MSLDQAGRPLESLDDHASLVAGPKRIHLTAAQKVGIAGLVAVIFLAFIWIDHGVQAKSANRSNDLALSASAAAFRPAPLLTSQDPTPPPAQPRQAGEMSPEESPLFAFGGSSGGVLPSLPLGSALTGQTETAGTGGQVVPAIATKGNDPSNAISSLLKPTEAHMNSATLLPHPDMLITKGTIIPCILQTAINTELAGFVKCVLPEAVRSTTGNVVLLDRGTTVVGEIQQGLSQGRKRVFILWDRAETPQHAIISLASPGTDDLGRTGVDGKVDNHFWSRFGSALMLSVVDGALQAGSAFAGGSGRGTGTYYNNFQSNGQQMADSALQSSINIPPTLEKKQGGTVSIFVANDIDFSSVYQLAMVK